MNNIVREMNEVYEMMEDDLSRQIFQARLSHMFYKDSGCFGACMTGSHANFIKEVGASIFTEAFAPGETVILYGAGGVGQDLWGKMHQWHPQCQYLFCDGNYENLKATHKYKEHLISIEELVEKYADCKVVVAIENEDIRLEVVASLREKGVNHLLVGLLYDRSQYFDEVVTLTDHEIFVDAGVLNGDTTLDFAQRCGGKYDKIYLFEADKSFEGEISANISELTKTELHMKGLWDREDTLQFVTGEIGNGRFSENGTLKMDVTSLDTVLQGDKITYLKMDIEGAELKALEGAKQSIQQHKPKLAICVYHKWEDILNIPLYVKSLVPEYKLYLRQYSNWHLETVLFAIPSFDRL